MRDYPNLLDLVRCCLTLKRWSEDTTIHAIELPRNITFPAIATTTTAQHHRPLTTRSPIPPSEPPPPSPNPINIYTPRTCPTALPLHSHNSPFPLPSSSHLSTDLLTFPTGNKNFPCAFPGASGLVAAYKEFNAPSRGVTVGVIFIVSCMRVPKKEGSLPWRLVGMTPGWRE